MSNDPYQGSSHLNSKSSTSYRVETITAAEYQQLRRLMEGLEQPGIDDLDLYDTGGHRDLYNYLTKGIGLTVQRGRGPAWHRAKALIEKYETGQL